MAASQGKGRSGGKRHHSGCRLCLLSGERMLDWGGSLGLMLNVENFRGRCIFYLEDSCMVKQAEAIGMFPTFLEWEKSVVWGNPILLTFLLFFKFL